MAGFKAPCSVEFLDALPLNATGKVMKDQLKEQVIATLVLILTPNAQDASIWGNWMGCRPFRHTNDAGRPRVRRDHSARGDQRRSAAAA